MKTIEQKTFYNLDIHPPSENEGGNIEIWQGKKGKREYITIEKSNVKELILALQEIINEGVNCSVKVEVTNEKGGVIGYAIVPTDINDLFK